MADETQEDENALVTLKHFRETLNNTILVVLEKVAGELQRIEVRHREVLKHFEVTIDKAKSSEDRVAATVQEAASESKSRSVSRRMRRIRIKRKFIVQRDQLLQLRPRSSLEKDVQLEVDNSQWECMDWGPFQNASSSGGDWLDNNEDKSLFESSKKCVVESIRWNPFAAAFTPGGGIEKLALETEVHEECNEDEADAQDADEDKDHVAATFTPGGGIEKLALASEVHEECNEAEADAQDEIEDHVRRVLNPWMLLNALELTHIRTTSRSNLKLVMECTPYPCIDGLEEGTDEEWHQSQCNRMIAAGSLPEVALSTIDPWPFLDFVVLGRIRATCTRNKTLVDEFTPFAIMDPANNFNESLFS
jgi:hypothetical protein